MNGIRESAIARELVRIRGSYGDLRYGISNNPNRTHFFKRKFNGCDMLSPLVCEGSYENSF